MRKSIQLGVLFMLITHASSLVAQASSLNVKFEKYQLENGLEVILHQDKRIPLVAVDVWYHVGGRNEVAGRSGFAHLFEHMLFQGSQNVGEDQHFPVLQKIGGSSVNGTTSTDRTNYYEVVPSHQLETALWLESDRMGFLLPALTQKSLDNQKEVVRNERRQRYDNSPWGKTQIALYAGLYPESHPHHFGVIGKHEDIASATLKDVKDFYTKWYTPSNATLALVGDFEIKDVKMLVEKWFGPIKGLKKPEEEKRTQKLTVNINDQTVIDPLVKQSRLTYAWHTPGYFQDGDAELDLLSYLLTSDGTGRLYKKLVLEGLATNVTSYQASQQDHSYFRLDVLLRPGVSEKKVDQIVVAELKDLAQKGVSEKELKRAVVNYEARYVWGLETLLARAEVLQRYNHYWGEPGRLEDDMKRYKNASAKSIKQTVADYLSVDKWAKITTRPETSKVN